MFFAGGGICRTPAAGNPLAVELWLKISLKCLLFSGKSKFVIFGRLVKKRGCFPENDRKNRGVIGKMTLFFGKMLKKSTIFRKNSDFVKTT